MPLAVTSLSPPCILIYATAAHPTHQRPPWRSCTTVARPRHAHIERPLSRPPPPLHHVRLCPPAAAATLPSPSCRAVAAAARMSPRLHALGRSHCAASRRRLPDCRRRRRLGGVQRAAAAGGVHDLQHLAQPAVAVAARAPAHAAGKLATVVQTCVYLTPTGRAGSTLAPRKHSQAGAQAALWRPGSTLALRQRPAAL